MNSISVAVQWKPVCQRQNKPYIFDEKPSAFLRKNYGAAVYQWRIQYPDTTPSCIYLGQTSHISTRIGQVVRSQSKKELKEPTGETTNRYLNRVFRDAKSKGATVFLDVVVFDDFSFNGVVIRSGKLGDDFHRCAVENLLLSVERRERPKQLLNRSEPPEDKLLKRFVEYIETLPRRKRERFMRDLPATLYGLCGTPAPDSTLGPGAAPPR